MSKNRGKPVSIAVSQNFLTSSKTIQRLLNLTGLQPSDTVLDIGAGKGHLTRALLQKCGLVIAYEMDDKLYQALQTGLGDARNLQLKKGDFLRSALPRKPYKVFSNIPFSITTDIIKKLTTGQNPPVQAWLFMEKGAAKRFCGKPGDSLQSLLLRPFFDTNIVYHFRREDFHPAPRTDVVLLHLSQKSTPDIPKKEEESYRSFVSHSVKNGLFGRQALLTKRQITTALRRAELDPIQPGGEVLYIQWLCLFRCWLAYG